MKYYKLSMDMERENDIVCHYQNDYGIQQNVFNVGRFYENWDGKFEFYYNCLLYTSPSPQIILQMIKGGLLYQIDYKVYYRN